MNGYPGYANYGPCPPPANQPVMNYTMPPGAQPGQAPLNYPPPFYHQPPYQGMYSANPPLYHQFTPGPYYPTAQNSPNPSHFQAHHYEPGPGITQPPFACFAPQPQPSQNPFVSYPAANLATSNAAIPNAPPLEDPTVGPVELTPPELVSTTDAALAIATETNPLDEERNEGLNPAKSESTEPLPDGQDNALEGLMAAVAITSDAVDLEVEEECKDTPPKQQSSKPAEEHKTDHGTIKPYHPFEPKQDAEALKKALKGLGTDEQAVFKILANRTQAQRGEISSVYEAMYHSKLVKDLKSELSGHLKEIARALMMSRVRYYAKCLLVALNGRGSLMRVMVEVYFTSTNSEIHEINEVFKHELKVSLGKGIKREAPGYFGHLIVAANYGTRDEKHHVDHDKVMADAKALISSIGRRWDRPDSVFTKLLVSKSYSHLRRVFEEYTKITGHTLEDSLKMRMSGTLLDGMTLIVNCIQNRLEFFAKHLRYAMKSSGTDDATIIRIIVTRSEIDLKLIKEVYLKLYKKPIGQHLFMKTDGDYRKVLLNILKTE